jgi:hypothetical protein
MRTLSRCVFLWVVFAAAIGTMGCDKTPTGPETDPLSPQTGRPAAPPAPAPIPAPASHPFAGTYAATLTIGSSCTAVPEAERTRAYTARFDRASEGSYVVSLTDATFLTGSICDAGSGRFAGIGCHQFFAHEDAGQMQFVLANNNDEAHGGHIVEQTQAGTWLEIIGEAVGARDPASMEAAGSGLVWRCGESRGYPFPCSSYDSCNSTELRLTLTRK